MAAMLLVPVAGLSSAVAPTAFASTTAGSPGSGPNGADPRPFWIFGHNPNQDLEVDNALSDGANALEPDVMRFDQYITGLQCGDGTVSINNFAGPSGLFVYHDDVAPTRCPETLEQWLTHVRAQADLQKNIAEIAFDIKPAAAAWSSTGPNIVQAVRSNLTQFLGPAGQVDPYTSGISIIYSVGTSGVATTSKNDADALFPHMPMLASNEGIQVDSENDPVSVLNKLAGYGITSNISYGNGSANIYGGLAPNVRPSIMEAAWMRVTQYGNFGIPYAFPICCTDSLSNDSTAGDEMSDFINYGVDGLIPDSDTGIGFTYFDSASKYVKAAVALVNSRSDVYMATSADNPWNIPKEGYGLRIKTTSYTNSNVTFKLTGCRGSASWTLNANHQKLFSSDTVNYVWIPSEDLGQLSQIELSDDGTDNWAVNSVMLGSDPYGNGLSYETWIYNPDNNGTSGAVTINQGSPFDIAINGNVPASGPPVNSQLHGCGPWVSGSAEYGDGPFQNGVSLRYSNQNLANGLTLTPSSGTVTCNLTSSVSVTAAAGSSADIDPSTCTNPNPTPTVSGHDAPSSLSYANGGFGVTQRCVLLNPSSPDYVYGDADNFSFGVTRCYLPGSGLVNGDTTATLGTPTYTVTLGGGVNAPPTTSRKAGKYGLFVSVPLVPLSGVNSHPFGGTITAAPNYVVDHTTFVTFTINPAPLTMTADAQSARVYGASNPTFTATVSGFKNGETFGASSSGVTGSASCSSTAGLTSQPGSYPITCTAGTLKGGTNYTISTFVGSTITVNAAPTTTSLSSSANPSVYGQTGIVTATVAANSPSTAIPTGSVAFTEGATTLGTVALDATGKAVLNTATLAPGTHTITASYTPDTPNSVANFVASASGSVSQVVNQDPTTTTLTSSANPSVWGQGITLTATPTANAPGSGSPSGMVDFYDGTTLLGSATITGGTASLPNVSVSPSELSIGTHTLSAKYRGDTNFVSSVSANLSQVVNKGSTATALASNSNPSVSGQSVTYTATVSVVSPAVGTPSGTVAFTDGTTTISGCDSVALSGTSATCTVTYPGTAGSPHAITGTYSGDSHFLGSSSTINQVVNKASTATALASTPNPSNFGQSVAFTATVTVNSPGAGTPTGTVQFSIDGSPFGTAATLVSGVAHSASIAALAPGTHTVTAAYNGDTNFLTSTSSNLSQQINATLISGSHTGSMTITGPTYLNGATISGRVTVNPGAALAISNSTINGSLSSSGATAIRVCGSTLYGPFSVSKTTGFILIGDNADDPLVACAGNQIPNATGAKVTLDSNKGGVELGGNQMGAPVYFTNNIGNGPLAEDLLPEIEGNTMSAPLNCSGNSPTPVNGGYSNQVSARKTGQCSAATF